MPNPTPNEAAVALCNAVLNHATPQAASVALDATLAAIPPADRGLALCLALLSCGQTIRTLMTGQGGPPTKPPPELAERRCKSCKARVYWVRFHRPDPKTGEHKAAPLDVQSTPTGNIIIESGFYRVVQKGDPTPGPRYTNHFFTCPQAAKFRKVAGILP